MPKILLPQFDYFYFMRHGQTDANAQGLMAGGGQDISLNAKGHEQARDASYIIKTKCPEIQTIVTSSMIRAIETATYVNQKLNIPMEHTDQLKEWSFGEWEGKPWEKVAPLFLDNKSEPTEGESRSTFIERVSHGLNFSLKKPSPVLIVAHGGVWYKIQILLNLPLMKSENCQIFKVFTESKNNLVSYNYVPIYL